MLLDANQPANALKEFEASLKKEPNRFRSVYGAGRAAGIGRRFARRRAATTVSSSRSANGPIGAGERISTTPVNMSAPSPPSGQPLENQDRLLFARSAQYPLLPRALEIELALSAAPKGTPRQRHGVDAGHDGYTMAHQGSNAFLLSSQPPAPAISSRCAGTRKARARCSLWISTTRRCDCRESQGPRSKRSSRSDSRADSIGRRPGPGRPTCWRPLRYRIDETGHITRTVSNPHLMFYGPNLTRRRYRRRPRGRSCSSTASDPTA